MIDPDGLPVRGRSAHAARRGPAEAIITPREAGGYGLDGQWSDDFHHAVHVALTGETEGYYADFEPLSALAKVCERGFFHDGSWSSFRDREHGKPIDTEHMPAWRLVVCNQNHDQVGNRARGDRIAEKLDDDHLVPGPADHHEDAVHTGHERVSRRGRNAIRVSVTRVRETEQGAETPCVKNSGCAARRARPCWLPCT